VLNKDIEREIFSIQSMEEFQSTALRVFEFQYKNCAPYKAYVDLLGVSVQCFLEIPFLPIDFFKTKHIISGSTEPEMIFESSGTTGGSTSRHLVFSEGVYQKSFKKCFEMFYGSARNYRILALLPSYLERGNSSLVYMVDHLIRWSKNPDSGFFLDDFGKLNEILEKPSDSITLLIGVSFGLLDFLDAYKPNLVNTIVMETGGMKGRRKEMIRRELHEKLKTGFGVSTIHSEFGMTELLSQAYSKGDGVFNTPPWMKLLVREVNDPLTEAKHGRTGGINVIDLANLYSCSFIATSDLGRCVPGKGVEILGRFDYSDIRGCNLMVAD